MNKHRFRLVFSRVLGFLIPVAETTRAQRKSGQTSGPAPVASTLLAVSVLLGGLPTWVAADILVDTTNPSGTNVISAANGVPVIEIAAPNSKGLSHNRFSEFDVKNPGLIFNNSLVNGQSQIGGALLRNPNLQRSATAILSEVTGNKPSSISGTLEVFGAKADLFIASPDGVTLNGVTTLNTSSLTVSTGHVKNADGGLQFLVDDTSGEVVIGGDGVNTEGLSYFDIVARSVELQGKLGSDSLLTDLQITAGQGTYDAATGTFTAKPGAQGSGVAIAGSAAGAMHGRYINLISSDSGAGVRQDGLILAAKDIAISAAGDIQLTTTTAKGNVQIASSASFTNAGAFEANTTQIKARDVLNLEGASLGGTNGLTIEAEKSVTNKGGELIGSTVSVKADSVRNTDQGKIVGTDIALTAQTDFSHDGKASIVAARNLSIDTGIFRATDGELLAGHNLTVAADSYQNSATLRSKNNANLTLKHGNDLVIDRAFKGPSADALLVLSARDVTITDELNTAGSVAINALRDVRNQGTVIVGKTLGITAKGLIDNQAGKLIWAGENLLLDAGTQLLNGVGSQLLAMGDMSLSAGEKLQNNTGRIEAQKSAWIDAPVVENLSQSTGGLKRTGTVKDGPRYDEKYGDWGEIQYFYTTITLPLYASAMTVKQAVIKAGGDLLFNPDKAKDAAAKVRNVGGLIAATGNVRVEGDLENLGVSTTKSLVDILKNAQSRTQWTVSSDVVKDDAPVDGSLYDMLQRTFGSNYSDQWVNSLKNIKTPEVNELISAVLGADWKALNQKQLQPRWAAFKAGTKTKTYYADQQAEISAGKTFQQEGGSLINGDGANAGGQRSITIQVGSEIVKSLDGELNAPFDAKRADADKALKAQLENPLFQRNQSGGAFGRIKPLYETRAKYLDQSQFLGSDYFLQKIGYDSSKTVSVLGDAYFDNQLILQNVEQRLGNFFAQTQRISGTDLAKQLLDNGAALALKAGLTLGEPLSDKQIAGLEKDVVWYENREVDGQLVLAPRVYLSQKTLAARDKDAKSSALVGGDTVLIDANAVNNFNGTVRGNTDAFIYAKTDINNVSGGGAQAGFFAGQGGKNEKAGQLVIAAEGRINNQGGVMSGYEQTVVGGEGISSSATTGYDKNGFLYVRDNGVFGTALSADTPKEEAKPSTEPAAIADTAKPADKDPQKVAAPDVRAIFDERLAAGPVDTSQGSSLNVISGGNIDLTAAITQSDNVQLQTTGNLNLNDLHEARSAFSAVNKSGFLSNVQITEVGSSANSVGNSLTAKNLAIKTGGDLNITGGEINAQNSAIEVGGNSTIKAGKDLAFHEKTTETTQLVIGGGVGAGGYEATGSWGTAPKVDTHLGTAFYGTDEGAAEATVGGQGSAQTPSIRGDVYAGRAANSQTLASNGTGARSGANKGRGATSGANFKVGLETVTTIDSSESATYRNAQLNLGNGSVKVGGTLDIGGADINSGYQLSPEERAKMTPEQRKAATDGMPTLALSAGDIKTTKVENTEKTRHVRDELFFGVTSEVHSSAIDIATQAGQLAHKAVGTDVVKDPNAPAGSSKTLATEDRKMDVDPALTAMAAVGLVTQAISGEVLGQSTTVGIKHTRQKSDSSSRSENINQLGGNISLTSTKGDIELNGVNLQGGKVGIKSAGNLTQRAAKSSTVSHDETNSQSVGLTTSIGVSATGVGAGISVGADGSGDKTTTTSTSYTNGLISGTEVSIETKGDHNLIGSNIKGNQVAVKVGGNQTITSVQDTSDMKHERNNWSASVGVAVTTNGLIQGTGSASASYGQDHDRSKLVAEQAGISADKLDLNVAGNLNLTGAHVTSQKGQGTVQVGGKINAQTLHDSREKDGGYAGGGGGISKNGLASVTVEFGRVDQVHYNATNTATIDVGDPNKVSATKGISGPLNTNTENQLNVTQNKRVAGTDVKVDFSAIADVKLAVGAVKKVFSPKTGGSVPTASKPTSRVPDGPSGQKTSLHPDAPKAVPNLYVEAPTAKPKYDQRVIVNTDANDPAVKLAVQNLVNKNPGTVVVEPDGKGSHNVLKGTLGGGTTKVEVVGHGGGMKVSGLDSKQLTDVVKSVSKSGDTSVQKLNLVGCKTGCSTEGNSLVNEVRNQLLVGGVTPQVKGYGTAIKIDEKGRKQVAKAGDPNALGGNSSRMTYVDHTRTYEMERPTFDQRIIVNTEPNNQAVRNAVHGLADRKQFERPDKMVVVELDGQRGHKVVQGNPVGGTTKVEVVGHGKPFTLGGLDSKQLADVVKNLAGEGTSIDKLRLVGCGTGCAKEGRSLVDEVSNLLQQQGIKPDIKGYETPVKINKYGNKVFAHAGDPEALGKDDPAQRPQTAAAPTTTGKGRPPAPLPKPIRQLVPDARPPLPSREKPPEYAATPSTAPPALPPRNPGMRTPIQQSVTAVAPTNPGTAPLAERTGHTVVTERPTPLPRRLKPAADSTAATVPPALPPRAPLPSDSQVADSGLPTPPPRPSRKPVGNPLQDAPEKTTVSTQPDAAVGAKTAGDTANVDAMPSGLTPLSVKQAAAPTLSQVSVNLIDQARAQRKITIETASFLKQAKDEISKHLETGPVLLGEHHGYQEAPLLIRQLIADGDAKQVIVELPSITGLIQYLRGYTTVISKLNEHGYSSAEDYLNRSINADGTRSDHELLEPILELTDKLKSGYVKGEPAAWNAIYNDAAKKGLKLHFIDKYMGTLSGTSLSGMQSRNKYMAEIIKNTPELKGPGVIGLFGADHLMATLNDTTVDQGLHRLAGIKESRTYDLSPAFVNRDTRKTHPRWRELNRVDSETAASRKSVEPPFKLDKTSITADDQLAQRYVEQKYKNRVIVDQSNTPESIKIATEIIEKHPENTVMFTQHGDSTFYKKGTSTDESQDAYAGKKTKIYVLRDASEPAPTNSPHIQQRIQEQAKRLLKRQFGHEMASLTIKTIAVKPDDTELTRASSNPISADKSGQRALAQPDVPNTYTDAPPFKPHGHANAQRINQPVVAPSDKAGSSSPAPAPAPASRQPEISPSLIDQAQAEKRIGNERASFLKQAKQEISKKLETGPVLLGEAHGAEDAPLVMRELIADGSVTQLMFELRSLTEYIDDIPDYQPVYDELQKRGYSSVEDYLNRSITPDGKRSDKDMLKPLLEVISLGGYSPGPSSLGSWSKIIKAGAAKGIKMHFVDEAIPNHYSITNAGVHRRNEYMAKKIREIPGLNAPGALGVFGAEHLQKMLVGTSVKEGLHGLANIDESRTYDLSLAYRDPQTRERFPRWLELNRDSAANVKPRESASPPFERDNTTVATDELDGPLYREAKYKNTVVIDLLNTPESMKLATKKVDKNPENTIVFSEFGKSLHYKEGNSTGESADAFEGKTTQLYILRKANQSASAHSPQVQEQVYKTAKEMLKRKFGHEMGTLKIKIKDVPDEPSLQSSLATKPQ